MGGLVRDKILVELLTLGYVWFVVWFIGFSCVCLG